MERDLVKRFIKKDGSQRISFYRDEYAENPRDMWDFPLHCEDWLRDYSIMNKQERDSKSSSARSLLEYMIRNYGDYKKVIDFLIENGKHMTDGYCKSNDALVYNKSEHRWDLMSDMLHYNSETRKNEMGWCLNNHYYEKKYYIDIYELLENVCDSTIDYLAQTLLTDKVKIMSYGFGCYGSMSFYREFSTDSEGIAWLEKGEALKDWITEEYWDKEDCYDLCDGMRNELEAWAEGEVYGFVVEDAVKYKTSRKCLSGNAEDEEYEETEWNEGLNSCWGFYGELDKRIDDMFENAGLNKEDFEEENV